MSKQTMDEKSAYVKAYFHINSEYGMGGWKNENSEDRFFPEICGLFENAGWIVKPGKRGGACPTVHREKESLYLHPMVVSGDVLRTSVEEVVQILHQGVCFQFRYEDASRATHDMTDEEYRSWLEEERPNVIADLLKLCETKRRNLFRPSDGIKEAIQKRYHLNRLEGKDPDAVEEDYFAKLIDELIEQNRLQNAETKFGIGYRTVK